MSNKLDLDVMGETVVEVLQEAAFVFAEPMEEATTDHSSKLVAKLDFTGPSSGQMFLTCSRNLATDFAANLLGIEPDDPEAESKGGDAVGEMLNIVGGALLARWFGVSGEFEMGVPNVTELGVNDAAGEIVNASLVLPLITDEGDRIDVGIIS